MANEYSAKSVIGYIIMIGLSVVAWASRFQTTMSQSTYEAECIALNSATKESLFIARMIEKVLELQSTIERQVKQAVNTEVKWTINEHQLQYDDYNQERVEFDNDMFASTEMELLCDNARLVDSLQKGNLANSKALRHFKTSFKFLTDQVKRDQVKLLHIAGTENPADLFTKVLTTTVIFKYKNIISLF